MEKEFEIGDTVRLLSGGPLMTVNESNKARDFVDCIWFNVEGNKCESTFKMAIIMHDDDFGLDEFEMEEDEWNDDSEEEK